MERKERKHLVIRADASTETGAGHLMRCLALAQAWQDNGGQATFITNCQNEDLLQRLRDEQFMVQRLDSPYPDRSDWDETGRILSASPVAWLVLDGYHFDAAYQKQVKEAGHRLLVIDDNAHAGRYYADIILNQNLHAEKLHYDCEPATRLLLGTRYVLLRREFLVLKNRERRIPEKARRVLVTLGGSDPHNLTLDVIRILQQLNMPGLEADVIIGAANPHAASLEAAVGKSQFPIRLTRDARNMAELMAKANVAVASGGTTCWELAFMGVPTVVLVLANNQAANAEVLRVNGAALVLDTLASRDLSALRGMLAGLLENRQTRQEMIRTGSSIVDGEGAARVIAAVTEFSPAPVGHGREGKDK